MKPQFLPLILLALAGCQQTPPLAVASNESTPQAAEAKRNTPLDSYLARPESAYHWQAITDGEFAPGDGDFNLRLTSQTWQGAPWTHRLQIFKPEKLVHPDAALLNVSFGSGSLPENILGRALANATGAYVVNVFNVPNQPLYGRSEDDLMAYSFGQYLESDDDTWPLLLPMTKSVVKAMDALQAWSKENGAPIGRFIVSGASKRGWTTYLTAAADERVVGAIPIVYNNLDLAAQSAHQREVWNGVSKLTGPYAQAGLFEKWNTPRGQKLVQTIDPWTVRARLTVPKLLINAANDGYWPLDALNLYRAGLPGRTDVFNVPNAPHVLGAQIAAAVGSAAAWSRLLLDGQDAPTVQMQVAKNESDHVFTLKTGAAPRAVRLWFASAPTRDFREAKWQSLETTAQDGVYRAALPDEKLFANGQFAQAWGEIEVAAQPLPLRLSSDVWESQTEK